MWEEVFGRHLEAQRVERQRFVKPCLCARDEEDETVCRINHVSAVYANAMANVHDFRRTVIRNPTLLLNEAILRSPILNLSPESATIFSDKLQYEDQGGTVERVGLPAIARESARMESLCHTHSVLSRLVPLPSEGAQGFLLDGQEESEGLELEDLDCIECLSVMVLDLLQIHDVLLMQIQSLEERNGNVQAAKDPLEEITRKKTALQRYCDSKAILCDNEKLTIKKVTNEITSLSHVVESFNDLEWRFSEIEEEMLSKETKLKRIKDHIDTINSTLVFDDVYLCSSRPIQSRTRFPKKYQPTKSLSVAGTPFSFPSSPVKITSFFQFRDSLGHLLFLYTRARSLFLQKFYASAKQNELPSEFSLVLRGSSLLIHQRSSNRNVFLDFSTIMGTLDFDSKALYWFQKDIKKILSAMRLHDVLTSGPLEIEEVASSFFRQYLSFLNFHSADGMQHTFQMIFEAISTIWFVIARQKPL